VAPGDIVQQGDLIGRIGSTGRSTGPHLDWRMYWQNQRVDPALLVPPMPPMPPKG
jgi:murein DD-endopeptidase MepM/ murein hydrolase activator NlpD